MKRDFTMGCTWWRLLFLLAVPFSVKGEVRYDSAYRSLVSFPLERLVELGDGYYDSNVLDSALICYTIASGRYDENAVAETKRLCAHALLRSGNIHYLMYSYVRAQDMYLRSLEICREERLDGMIPRLYNNLGNIYSSFNDYRKAEEYYKKAYADGKDGADSTLQTVVLNNLVGIYSNSTDTDTLRYYIGLSEKMLKDASKSYFILSGKGILSFNEGDYPASIRYQKEALRLADSLRLNADWYCSALLNIADAFDAMQQGDSVEHYLLRCADIAVENGLLDMQVNAYRELADLYNVQNRAGKFLRYTKLYQAIGDSIKGIQGYRNLKDVELLFEMNQIDKEIGRMRMEQVRKDARYANQRAVLYVVCAILVLIVGLLLYIYRQKQQLQRSYRDIFERNREIVDSERQARLRYGEYEQAIGKRDALIARLQGQLTEQPEEGEKGADMPALLANRQAKYQGSSLNREQREQLAGAIHHVMENTQEFCNVDFTLEKMANLTGSKTKYVSQVINETYGKNFNRFVNEYRIKEARLRLTNTEEYGQYTVKAIAQSVGFKSVTNFNSLFKELIGITPSMYQSMVRK